MIAFLLRRIASGLLVILAVALLAYALTFIAPADPAKSIAGPKATVASLERIRASLGLDRPAHEQAVDYLLGVARLDLGRSYQSGGLPVIELISQRLPATLELALAGVLLALLVGLPLGVLSAERPGSWLDRLASVLSSFMVAVPTFLLGFALIYVFAFRLRKDLGIGLFPIANSSYHPLDLPGLALPAVTLMLALAPFYIRVARTTMLEELHSDYVRTARSKGLPRRSVVWRHAFRNASPVLATQVGLDLGFLLGGIVVIEAVFSWPGIGELAARSITSEDLPLLMGTLLFGTMMIVLANLVVDVVYALLDPRITHW